MQALTPPDIATPTITLEAPQPVLVIPQDEADQIVKLDQTKVPDLDAKVNDFVMNILQAPVNTSTFDDNVNAIHQLGNAEIRASAQISNRMLDRPASSMDKALFENSPIAKSLTELRGVIEQLDPSKVHYKAPVNFWALFRWVKVCRTTFANTNLHKHISMPSSKTYITAKMN